MDQIRRSTEQITPLHMSFGAFLVHLLPQTRILFQYLQHEQAYQQVNMRQQHNPFQFTGMSSGTYDLPISLDSFLISLHHRNDCQLLCAPCRGDEHDQSTSIRE